MADAYAYKIRSPDQWDSLECCCTVGSGLKMVTERVNPVTVYEPSMYLVSRLAYIITLIRFISSVYHLLLMVSAMMQRRRATLAAVFV